ncbi:UNVERIFIED_CONTAM: hypothetical protein Slati_0472200 [Sesamum latifolium]|uniref:Uncharacterized protein n=1 Tax=Sesamum latifolium TaxID=2727402 RepID=A0AAW2XXT2_9LAMI
MNGSHRVGDNSSVEVSEEVLRRGGSATRPTTPGGGILAAEAAGVDPPLAEVGGIPVTTCKAWVLPDVSTAFCLFAGLLGISMKTHVLNSVFPQTAAIDACDFSTGPMNLDFELGYGPRNKELEKETCEIERGLLELIPEFGGVFIAEDSLVNKESLCPRSLELQGVLAARGSLVLLVWTEQEDVLYSLYGRQGDILRPQGVLTARGSPSSTRSSSRQGESS